MILASCTAPYSVAVDYMAAIKDVYMPPPKKLPGLHVAPLDSNMAGYIACSSTLNGDMDDSAFISESFDSEEQVIVG